MNYKFKIGERVIIEETNIDYITHLRGKNVVGTIIEINDDPDSEYPYLVVSDYNRYGLYCKVKCLASEFRNEKIVITHDGKNTTATLYDGDTKVAATARCAPEDNFEFRVGAEIAMARLIDKLVYSKFNIVRVVLREGGRPYSYKTRMQTAKVGMEIVVPVGRHGKELNATVVEIIPGAEYDGDYAISAMKEIDIVEVPKYYNGKVVCVKSECDWWIVGKIYTFVNGTVIDDDGTTRYRSNPWESLDRCKTTNMKFIEIVE